MSHYFTEAQLRAMAEEFQVQGYLRIEEALSAEQVARFEEAVARHRREYPEDWIELSDSFCEGTNILPRTADFDEAIENPKTLDVLRAILGEGITFEEFAIMIRNPTENLQEVKGWHRDLIREYHRRHEIEAVSILMFLTDVKSTDHCFTIVPESHDRLLDLDPVDVAADAGVDVIGPAGTAVIFHARAIHNARLKAHSTQRRTLQAYFAQRGDQRTAEWSEIPPRLYTKQDPTLPPHLYSKWNVRNILDGVGRRPPDIAPDLPLAEVIREVQRRGREKMRA
ncbi:MAG TPA: phytanoyl-CoA dioxygenase family protein [Pirellulales bacterium]|jgi:ectoine hydroxylase-related dioxygenase (phytanoyl-CoA dioxygenase family)